MGQYPTDEVGKEKILGKKADYSCKKAYFEVRSSLKSLFLDAPSLIDYCGLFDKLIFQH